eukprot:4202274-Prymnesium_polylepis.1
MGRTCPGTAPASRRAARTQREKSCWPCTVGSCRASTHARTGGTCSQRPPAVTRAGGGGTRTR